MRSYWDNLNERERRLGLGAIIFLVLFVLYQFVYSPVVALNEAKHQELKDKSTTLAWMQETKQKSQNLGNEKPISSGRLLGVIATELNKRPFVQYPHQIQQTSQGNIQVSFEAVPFKELLTWLWSLENTYLITIKQLDSNRTATAGVVKIMVLIDANT